MKTFLMSAIAATLAVGPVMATAAEAAPQHHTVTTVKERPNGRTVVTTRTVQPRNWRAGQRFDRRYATNYRVVRDFRTYRLGAPPRGHYWARSGRDAVLVRDNGTVVRVIGSRF